MVEAEKPKPRRRLWKTVLRGMIVLAVLAAAGIFLLPLVLPEPVLRKRVESALSERLGRPVALESVAFRWSGRLALGGVRIAESAETPDAILARADRMVVRFSPVDFLWSLVGGDLPIEIVRVEGLELWLVLREDHRWNFEIAGPGRPPRIRSVQVTGGQVHFENRLLGRSITFTGLHASLGQLESTGRGYVNLEAELSGSKPGAVCVTAGLESLDLAGRQDPPAGRSPAADEGPAGSLKIEWSDVAWSEVAAAVTSDARLRGAAGLTSGRLAAAFGHGGWSAEGAVDASEMILPAAGGLPGVAIPGAVLGFQVRQASPEKPIEVSAVKFSAPGVDLKISGIVRPEWLAPVSTPASVPASPGRSPATPGQSPAAAAPPATASGQPAPPAPVAPRPKAVDLQVTGRLLWAPLAQNMAALKPVADRFERLGGSAELALHLTDTDEGIRATGSADLSDTLAVWPEVVRKEVGQTLRLEMDALCPLDFTRLDLARLELLTDAGRALVQGRLPLVPSEGDLGHRLAGARMDLTVEVKETQMLLAMAPVLAAWLEPAEMRGPMGFGLSCKPLEGPRPAGLRPGEAGDAGSPSRVAPGDLAAWVVKAQADLTQMRLAVPDGAEKHAGTRAKFDVSGLIVPDARTIRLHTLQLGLAAASLEWNGVAELKWPRQVPPGLFQEDEATQVPWLLRSLAGHLEGTLKVSRVEAALAVLVPGRPSSPTGRVDVALPVEGEASFDLAADLADGKLSGRIASDLKGMAIRVKDYFVKPAGQPASVALAGSWQVKAGEADAKADIQLPGARVQAAGHGMLQIRRQAPAAADGGATGRSLAGLRRMFSPDSTLKVSTTIADLAQAVQLLPAVAGGLGDRKVAGAAESDLLFVLKPRAIHVEGGVNLTGAALDLEPVLRKPLAMPLRLDIAMDLLPPEETVVELVLAKAEARLGDSVAGATGRVRLTRPGSLGALKTGAQVLALFQGAEVEVYADVDHTAEFRRAMPCLEPWLYSKADLEGRTSLTALFSGTALRGKVGLSLDATGCHILHGPSILKPAGTPATVRLEGRFGEVPGELILDSLEMKLADSSVTADGRMFFDNPRLAALVPPTAWSVRLAGQAPDAASLASLFPARLADLKPTGGVSFKVQASGDALGAEIQACDFLFDKASLVWLGKSVRVNGPISYDGQRLATDGLNLVAGQSDVLLTAYITQPDHAPTGSVLLRGKTLALNEVLALIQQTSERVASWSAEPVPPASPGRSPAGRMAGPRAAAKAGPAAPTPLSEQLFRYGQRLLARARLSWEMSLDKVTFTIPDWSTTYELTDLKGDGRLADERFVVPHLECRMNGGRLSADVSLDFSGPVPVLMTAYEARDLQAQENLHPFINATFPGLQVYGTSSQRNRSTRLLTGKCYPTGRGETVLTDGVLVGQAAPDYIAYVLPGLKLTEYRFTRMSNDFEDKGDGDCENRMIFEGQGYNIYIFGKTKADGRFDYTLGVDLLASLGSKVLTRTLDQGKLPLMYYTGRIVGSQMVERDIRYVLPHEFAYDVFVKRNLLVQLAVRLGQKPPRIERPAEPPAEPTSRGAAP